MKQFSNKYSSASLDEGSTLKTPHLDHVIHNTKEKLGEYAATTEIMNGVKNENYIDIMPRGISFLKKFNINGSIVIVDGNTAQLKVFNDSYNKSL